jgi:hypothetical protein
VWAKERIEPNALASKPDLPAYLLEYYRAFRTLSTRRPFGAMGGISPISLSDMLAYIALYETDDPDFFVSVICRVDSMYLKHYIEKSNANSKARTKK